MSTKVPAITNVPPCPGPGVPWQLHRSINYYNVLLRLGEGEGGWRRPRHLKMDSGETPAPNAVAKSSRKIAPRSQSSSAEIQRFGSAAMPNPVTWRRPVKINSRGCLIVEKYAFNRENWSCSFERKSEAIEAKPNPSRFHDLTSWWIFTPSLHFSR